MGLFALLTVVILPTVAYSTNPPGTVTSNCTALSGLHEFPCILPFNQSGKVHSKCAILDDDMPLPECPVSADLKIWGVCRKNCFHLDPVEPTLDEEIAPIYAELRTHREEQICGGVLISDEHVLVAAHCIKSQSYLERNGKILVKSYMADTFLKSEHRIQKIVLHDNFNGSTFENDIAIIFLKSQVQDSNFAEFAIIPLENFEHQSLHYAGRDQTDGQTVYQHFPMELESSVFCKRLFKALGRRTSVGKFQICATYKKGSEGHKDACRGRKSGILYYKKDEEFHVVGILASNEENCQPYVPSIFVNLHSYLSWITNQTGLQYDSRWHMTIGGYTGHSIRSVELYNWKTGKQCYIDPLPQATRAHSGTLMNGDPVVCGGNDDGKKKTDCYHYQRDKKKWTTINSLIAPTYFAASIRILNKGWYLLGGNDLETSQKLVNISSNWEAGPAVQRPMIEGQCSVQINETVTAFIGGEGGHDRNIYTLDWTSENPKFVLQNEKLKKERISSTCGLIRGKDGLPVVAIIGGWFPDQRGMEIWNPRLKTVELLWDVIPPEEGGTDGFMKPGMVILKDGREIVFYGGWKGSFLDGIWKYISADNSWKRIGNLLGNRSDLVTLPVLGLECP